MREHQVDAARVDVDAGAQELAAHRRTLDVPACNSIANEQEIAVKK
jgi:hypothetical protein